MTVDRSTLNRALESAQVQASVRDGNDRAIAGSTPTFTSSQPNALPVSDAVRKLLAAGAPAKQIKAQARSEKMRYLQEDGLIKVIAGKTSMAEIMRGLRSDAK